jgi:hypothetical protein
MSPQPVFGLSPFFLSFFFLISDHFIQKPCYIITLCSQGELHRGPCGLHNSFDQGKYQNELKKNTLPFIHKMKITNIPVHKLMLFLLNAAYLAEK